MFSINTNNASMAALESLRMTNADLTTAQNAVSTGLSVSSASDNPAVYAIAQQMNGNIAGLSAVSSGLSFGSSVVGTASSATTSIISTLQTLQNTITQSGTTGINLATMQSQVADALNQINTYARSSTFQGVNLLTSQADGGSSVSSPTMSIVDGLQGSTLTVANQAAATKPGAVTLTDALGLTSSMGAGGTVIASGTAGTGQVDQKILTGNSTGQNIAVSSTLVAGSFADGSNVVIKNGDGTTTTFEFDASGTAPTAANTTGANANKTAVVTVNTGTESSNQMVGDLVSAMNANGYSAAVQNDGSINVTGQGLTAFTSSVTGLTSASSASTALSAGASAITTIQSAINSMTGIADRLGYTTQQITGMQSFTGNLSDALTSGVGALTDADLSAESAKLTSLQTKQQLAIQSLSIANSQSQSILSLFR